MSLETLGFEGAASGRDAQRGLGCGGPVGTGRGGGRVEAALLFPLSFYSGRNSSREAKGFS